MSKKDTKQAADPQPETPIQTATAEAAPENRMISPGMLRVRVARQAICEEGAHYSKGEELFVPAPRRAALGALVEDLEIEAKG